jgi:hypothetical protein
MRVVLVVLLGLLFAAGVGLTVLVTGSDKWTTVVVAFFAAMAVAWQSFETRRAASAAEKALRGAADSLRVSQVLAIEAERRRLDAVAPRLVVRVNAAEWPPRVGRQFVGSEPAQLPQGDIFRLPKDGPRHLLIRADGFVRNEGDTTVRVAVHGMSVEENTAENGYPKMKWGEPGYHEFDIPAGERARFMVEDERPASDWIANTEATESSQVAPMVAKGVIVANDLLDNGIIDTWEVVINGHPFERIPGEDAGWRLVRDLMTGRGPMVAAVLPRVRTYWRSKVQQQRLPEIDLPASTLVPGGRG